MLPNCGNPICVSIITIPEVLKPINAINRPIPAPAAIFSPWGIALIIVSRIFVKVRIKKIRPDVKTPANAVCHSMPIPITTA